MSVMQIKEGEVGVIDQTGSLEVVEGLAWVTKKGCYTDWILGPGEKLSVRRGDQALAQAIGSGLRVALRPGQRGEERAEQGCEKAPAKS